MKKRRILWPTFFILFATLVCCAWLYTDRMCKEYMGERLTPDLIDEHLKVMTEGAILPKGEWSYGMDISHHQPFIIWNKLRILVNQDGRTVLNEDKAVRTESIDYVFMKATEGESFKDWRFKGRWKKAKKAGITRGAYHFFRPGKNAVDQAQSYIRRVGELDGLDKTNSNARSRSILLHKSFSPMSLGCVTVPLSRYNKVAELIHSQSGDVILWAYE